MLLPKQAVSESGSCSPIVQKATKNRPVPLSDGADLDSIPSGMEWLLAVKAGAIVWILSFLFSLASLRLHFCFYFYDCTYL